MEEKHRHISDFLDRVINSLYPDNYISFGSEDDTSYDSLWDSEDNEIELMYLDQNAFLYVSTTFLNEIHEFTGLPYFDAEKIRFLPDQRSKFNEIMIEFWKYNTGIKPQNVYLHWYS